MVRQSSPLPYRRRVDKQQRNEIKKAQNIERELRSKREQQIKEQAAILSVQRIFRGRYIRKVVLPRAKYHKKIKLKWPVRTVFKELCRTQCDVAFQQMAGFYRIQCDLLQEVLELQNTEGKSDEKVEKLNTKRHTEIQEPTQQVANNPNETVDSKTELKPLPSRLLEEYSVESMCNWMTSQDDESRLQSSLDQHDIHEQLTDAEQKYNDELEVKRELAIKAATKSQEFGFNFEEVAADVASVSRKSSAVAATGQDASDQGHSALVFPVFREGLTIGSLVNFLRDCNLFSNLLCMSKVVQIFWKHSIPNTEDRFRTAAKLAFRRYVKGNSNVLKAAHLRDSLIDLGLFLTKEEVYKGMKLTKTKHAGQLTFSEFLLFWNTRRPIIDLHPTDTDAAPHNRISVLELTASSLANRVLNFDGFSEVLDEISQVTNTGISGAHLVRDRICLVMQDIQDTKTPGLRSKMGQILMSTSVIESVVRYENAMQQVFVYYSTQEWIRLAHQRRNWEDVKASEIGLKFIDFVRFASEFGLYPNLISNDVIPSGNHVGSPPLELLNIFLSASQGKRLGIPCRCTSQTTCSEQYHVKGFDNPWTRRNGEGKCRICGTMPPYWDWFMRERFDKSFDSYSDTVLVDVSGKSSMHHSVSSTVALSKHQFAVSELKRSTPSRKVKRISASNLSKLVIAMGREASPGEMRRMLAPFAPIVPDEPRFSKSQVVNMMQQSELTQMIASTTQLSFPEFLQCVTMCARVAFSKKIARKQLEEESKELVAETMKIGGKLKALLVVMEPTFRSLFNRAMVVENDTVEVEQEFDDNLEETTLRLERVLSRIFFYYSQLSSQPRRITANEFHVFVSESNTFKKLDWNDSQETFNEFACSPADVKEVRDQEPILEAHEFRKEFQRNAPSMDENNFIAAVKELIRLQCYAEHDVDPFSNLNFYTGEVGSTNFSYQGIATRKALARLMAMFVLYQPPSLMGQSAASYSTKSKKHRLLETGYIPVHESLKSEVSQNHDNDGTLNSQSLVQNRIEILRSAVRKKNTKAKSGFWGAFLNIAKADRETGGEVLQKEKSKFRLKWDKAFKKISATRREQQVLDALGFGSLLKLKSLQQQFADDWGTKDGESSLENHHEPDKNADENDANQSRHTSIRTTHSRQQYYSQVGLASNEGHPETSSLTMQVQQPRKIHEQRIEALRKHNVARKSARTTKHQQNELEWKGSTKQDLVNLWKIGGMEELHQHVFPELAKREKESTRVKPSHLSSASESQVLVQYNTYLRNQSARSSASFFAAILQQQQAIEKELVARVIDPAFDDTDIDLGEIMELDMCFDHSAGVISMQQQQQHETSNSIATWNSGQVEQIHKSTTLRNPARSEFDSTAKGNQHPTSRCDNPLQVRRKGEANEEDNLLVFLQRMVVLFEQAQEYQRQPHLLKTALLLWSTAAKIAQQEQQHRFQLAALMNQYYCLKSLGMFTALRALIQRQFKLLQLIKESEMSENQTRNKEDSSVSHTVSDHTQELEAVVFGHSAHVHLLCGQLGDATREFEEMAKLAKLSSSLEVCCQAYEGLGRCYWLQGDEETSLKSFAKQMQLGRSLHSNQVVANGHSNIAYVKRASGDILGAIEAHNNDINLQNKSTNKSRGLHHLGECYMALGKYTEAYKFHRQNLHIGQKALNRLTQSVSNAGVANSLLLGSFQVFADNDSERTNMFPQLMVDEPTVIAVTRLFQDLEGLCCGHSFKGDNSELHAGILSQTAFGEAKSLTNTTLVQRKLCALVPYDRVSNALGETSLGFDGLSKEILGTLTLGSRCGKLGICNQQVLTLAARAEAAEHYARFAELARGFGDSAAEAEAQSGLGMTYACLGFHDEALGAFVLELHLRSTLGEFSAVVAGTRTRIAWVLSSQGKWKEAQQYLVEEVQLCEKLALIMTTTQNEPSSTKIAVSEEYKDVFLVLARNRLAEASYMVGDIATAREEFAKALKTTFNKPLLETLYIEAAEGLGLINLTLAISGTSQTVMNKIECHTLLTRGSKYFRVVLAKCHGAISMVSCHIRARVYCCLSTCYRMLGRYSECIPLLRGALVELNKLGSRPFELAKVHSMLGNCFADLGELEKAKQAFQDQLHFARKASDVAEEVKACTSLGRWYYQTGTSKSE